jgi:putative Holliday junction resolvase
MDKSEIYGIKLAGIDFGRKRIGIAVCDRFHVAVRPLANLDYTDDNFWDNFISMLKNESVEAAVVGVPFREDNKNKELIDDIESFIDDLKAKSGFSVYQYDEFFSSKDASRNMIQAGVRKSKRKEKGMLDQFAAAVILRNFLDENESL